MSIECFFIVNKGGSKFILLVGSNTYTRHDLNGNPLESESECKFDWGKPAGSQLTITSPKYKKGDVYAVERSFTFTNPTGGHSITPVYKRKDTVCDKCNNSKNTRGTVSFLKKADYCTQHLDQLNAWLTTGGIKTVLNMMSNPQATQPVAQPVLAQPIPAQPTSPQPARTAAQPARTAQPARPAAQPAQQPAQQPVLVATQPAKSEKAPLANITGTLGKAASLFSKPKEAAAPAPAAQPASPVPTQSYQPPPGQPYPGQQFPAQQFPGQPYPGQPYPGQQYPGQQYPGQPYPGQQYPGQQFPGQPYPGQPYPAPAVDTSAMFDLFISMNESDLPQKAIDWWIETAGGKKLELTQPQFQSGFINIAKKQFHSYMAYIDAMNIFADGKMTLSEYANLCKGHDLMDGLKLGKAKYEKEHFVPDLKKALLIGNKNYKASAHGLSNLESVSADIKKMEGFLTEKAGFEDEAVTKIWDSDIETLKQKFSELRTWAKSLTYDMDSNEERKPADCKKGLLVIHYSGHGMIIDGVTNIVTPDGSFFPLPLLVNCANKKTAYGIGLSVYPNLMVVVFMDCCRVLPKAASDPEPVGGQYYIYYAVGVGTPASAGSKDMSVFTKKLLGIFDSALEERKQIVIPDSLVSLEFSERGATMSVDLAYKINKDDD